MTRLGHLWDGSGGWEQRIGLTQLVEGLPGDRLTHHIAALDPQARALAAPLARRVAVLPRFGGAAVMAAPAVAGWVRRRHLDLIHAWGVRAAAAARAVADTPLILELFDPRVASRYANRLRAMARPTNFAVICSCATVRRRLVEGGFPPELAVVVRPGVDFGTINQAQRSALRGQLGVTEKQRLLVVPEPVTRDGGQFEAFWAVAMENSITNGLRIILPGHSRELQRIASIAATVPGPAAAIWTKHRYPFEQLVSVSDALLVTPQGDTSTTCIAWAMAANTAVIATAVYATAELIAHKVNGLLFKPVCVRRTGRPVSPRSMNAPLLKLLHDHDSQRKAKEVARGQAYEAFGLRRYVEQHKQLYENVLRQAPPGAGIVD